MTDAERALFQKILAEGAEGLGAPLIPVALDACAAFADRLLTVNTQMNLTRITEPGAVAVKHFVDSLTLLSINPPISESSRILDVGTGAGFPGVPLRIVRPDLKVTLMDSLAKRLSFLDESLKALGLGGVTLVHARAEDAGRDAAFRERFDLVTARAVAALPTLLEWCGPLVAIRGRFVAMKTSSADDEIAASRAAAATLGLTLTADISLTLPLVPGEEEAAPRRLLVYEKKRATPARYPRRSAEIKAKPLGGTVV